MWERNMKLWAQFSMLWPGLSVLSAHNVYSVATIHLFIMAPCRILFNLSQQKKATWFLLGFSGSCMLFSAAHSNTFPFVPLIFLERQFPPCTRTSHILCKMLRNSTLPLTFYLCRRFDYPVIFCRKSDSSLLFICNESILWMEQKIPRL